MGQPLEICLVVVLVLVVSKEPKAFAAISFSLLDPIFHEVNQIGRTTVCGLTCESLIATSTQKQQTCQKATSGALLGQFDNDRPLIMPALCASDGSQ